MNTGVGTRPFIMPAGWSWREKKGGLPTRGNLLKALAFTQQLCRAQEFTLPAISKLYSICQHSRTEHKTVRSLAVYGSCPEHHKT